MLITDKKELEKYYSCHRKWQGIPSVEVTRGGRIFSTFYSGGVTEMIGNYSLVLMSDDFGKSFSEPIAVAYKDDHRCYDPCLWIDPLGRLWFTWAIMPNHAVYGAICEDPDAAELVWGDEFVIGYDVMMNKPTVLSSGEWLFPIAVWNLNIGTLPNTKQTEKGAFVYRTTDNGKSFERLGAAQIEKRSFDEHMLLEMKDGRLMMLVRTTYGIASAYSDDKGLTWSQGEDSKLGGPSSRFHITRLRSGRILLVNHYNYKGRNNLYALLSDDECKTWKYKLLLDERNNVSYPDVKEADDGYIYITYDRERGAFYRSWADIEGAAREILLARVSEEDILKGEAVSEGSYLKRVVSKLSTKLDFSDIPDDPGRLNDEDLANMLLSRYKGNVLSKIFEYYPVSCENMQRLESERLDALAERLGRGEDIKTVLAMISLVRSVSDTTIKSFPIVNSVKCAILENLKYDISLKEIAEKVGMSMYYMMHTFKKDMGITITEYKNQLKIFSAKKMLLDTDKKITEISTSCGFENSSYFSKLFTRVAGISPTEYRKSMRERIAALPEGFKNITDKDMQLYDLLKHISLLDGKKVTVTEAGDAIERYTVTLPSEEYIFLHEAAVIVYNGVVFAAWYNNTKAELQGRTPIRFARSFDGGKTFTEPKTVADDRSGNILYCPPVFGITDDRLYMLMNQMVSADHIHSLDLYVYNGDTDEFELVRSEPIPFKLNTNAYKLANGKLIIAGRIAELDGFPITPAVIISDNGRMDGEWRVVKMQENGVLPDDSSYVHPEPSLIIDGSRVYAFVRNDLRQFSTLYVSEDNGESWSEPMIHDLPFSNSKIYSDTLSDGRSFVIANVQPDRKKLVMYLSQKGSMTFDKCIVLEDGFSERLGYGEVWHYPCTWEDNGKLYVIYTVNLGKTDLGSGSKGWHTRGAVLAVIDISKI